MGLLDEPGLDRLIAAGCACGSQTLLFRTYVDGVFPFVAAEPVGRVTWAYDGERFVDGVYRRHVRGLRRDPVFGGRVPAVPRARRSGTRAGHAQRVGRAARVRRPGLRRGGDQVRRLRPGARHATSSGRADKARTATEPHDDGFHGLRATCRGCGAVAVERTDAGPCPLCEAPGPLRARPGG